MDEAWRKLDEELEEEQQMQSAHSDISEFYPEIIPPEDLGNDINRFDQDDNSDLEEVDKALANNKERNAILEFLYGEMRQEIKGINC